MDEEKYADLEESFVVEEKPEESLQGGQKIFFRTNFSSAVKYVSASNFEYAALECSFGNMKVFFDDARIPGGSATIDLSVSFGAVQLYLPKEWYVNKQPQQRLSHGNADRGCELFRSDDCVYIIGFLLL